MRLTVLCVTALISVSTARADEPPATHRLLEQWSAAWTEGDVAKMMTFYDSSKDTTAIESLGTIRKGPDEIRAMYQEAFEELTFDRVTLTPVVQGGGESAAWGTYRYVADVRLKSNGSKYVLEVLGTFVMRKADDTWRISLEHFSTLPDVPRARAAQD